MNKKQQILFKKQAEIVKAVAHPLRIAIINFLQPGPQCVCDITKFVNSEQSNVSKHLSIMVKAGILSSDKQGLKVIYTLKRTCIFDFLGCITDCLIQQHKEDQAILKAL